MAYGLAGTMISITDSRSGHQGCRAYQQHRKGTLVAWENEHVKETTCKDVLLFIDNICNVTSRDLWRYTGPLDFFWAYILGSSASRAYPGHMFSYSSAGCSWFRTSQAVQAVSPRGGLAILTPAALPIAIVTSRRLCSPRYLQCCWHSNRARLLARAYPCFRPLKA